MSFRIERLVGGENVIVFRVCGRVQIECVDTIKELIEVENAKIDMTLAIRDAATFFAACELKGIELRN